MSRKGSRSSGRAVLASVILLAATSVNAATPLIIGNLAFFSTSYETGALLIAGVHDAQ